jgi:16S rRNA (cytosine1402-N4)-methyltransferase
MNSIFAYTETEDFEQAYMSENGESFAYHKPVMLKETIREMEVRPGGSYVDVTFGGGGHSAIMVQLLQGSGHLYSFDQDPDARKNANDWGYPNFTFFQANFRHMERYLATKHMVGKVDAILADLGISSFQIDEPGRGFSIRHDGPLDMRMSPEAELSAIEVVNEYPEEDLIRVLREYGEVENPRRLAQHIMVERARQPILTTGRLKDVVIALAPRKREFKFLAQVFQAIRIEVNDELGALEEMLRQSAKVLAPGGRLVVLTYHSLEDRLVKNFIMRGNFEGRIEKDIYGNDIRPLEPVWRKGIVPGAEELAENPRARSAKLRVAKKLPPRGTL